MISEKVARRKFENILEGRKSNRQKYMATFLFFPLPRSFNLKRNQSLDMLSSDRTKISFSYCLMACSISSWILWPAFMSSGANQRPIPHPFRSALFGKSLIFRRVANEAWIKLVRCVIRITQTELLAVDRLVRDIGKLMCRWWSETADLCQSQLNGAASLSCSEQGGGSIKPITKSQYQYSFLNAISLIARFALSRNGDIGFKRTANLIAMSR